MSLPDSDDPARRRRLREVQNAVLSQTFGGNLPSAEVLAQLHGYVEGTVSREDGFRGLYAGRNQPLTSKP
jgi:hypothetical protein